MKWIDAKIIPPDMSCDIVALYSENGNYVECIRPKVLSVAREPHLHYYETDCTEVGIDQIYYYINLPENPKR